MGLFYNGNNPLDLRSAYGNSDFDRTHVINFNLPLPVATTSSRRSLSEGQVRRWLGHSRDSPFSKAASPTASSTTRARSAASSTACPTASPIPSFRWRRAARRRTRLPAPAAPPQVFPALNAGLLHVAVCSPGRFGRRHSLERPLRDQLHHRPAQHLPATLATACGHLVREDHASSRSGSR